MTIMVKRLVSLLIFCLSFILNAEDIDDFFKKKVCIKCDLSNARFIGDFQHATIDDSLLTNCEFIYSNFDKSSFDGCFLTKSQAQSFWNPYYYSLSSFREASFKNAFLNFTSFSSVEFSGADFQNANLRHANFENANLSNTNFVGAVVDDANFKNTILIGSNITEEQLATVMSKECAVLPNGQLYITHQAVKCVF